MKSKHVDWRKSLPFSHRAYAFNFPAKEGTEFAVYKTGHPTIYNIKIHGLKIFLMNIRQNNLFYKLINV